MYINEKHLSYIYEDEVQIDANHTLKKQNLGDLFLKTGNIVANDPLVMFELEPLTLSVAPGSYPVSIHISNWSSPLMDDKRVALAALRFSDKKAIRWEMALADGQDPDNVKDGKLFYGYGVDSGTGGFMDKSAADEIGAKLTDDASYEKVYKEIDKQMEETYVDTYSYAIGNMTDGTQNDFVAFSSGFGDGCYPSYFGFDDMGELCALATDFLALD